MPSIVISADELDACEEVAQQVAKALGYRYAGPELLTRLAEQHNVKEGTLRRAFDGASYRRLTSKTRDLLLAYVQLEAFEQLTKDNVVCVGLGAHLYVRDISHVIMVRVLTRAADAKLDAKTRKQRARELERRVRWSVESFGVDESDPSVYDMVFSLGQIELDKIIEIIGDMTKYRKFQPMTYSRRCLADLTLSARARVALLPKHSEIKVRAEGDTLNVRAKCSKRSKQRVVEEVKEIAGQLPGVKLVKVHAVTRARELNEEL